MVQLVIGFLQNHLVFISDGLRETNIYSSHLLFIGLTKTNLTVDGSNYDDYYQYDEDGTSDKYNLNEEDEYLDDYAEPINKIIGNVDPLRKSGVCSRIIASNVLCDQSSSTESDCRFDTDCPGDEKCCETACQKRVCSKPLPGKHVILILERTNKQTRRVSFLSIVVLSQTRKFPFQC